MLTVPKSIVISLALVMAVILAACDGPAGPAGPQGPQGEQGPQGQQGAEGQQGTANVMYSPWLDIELEENTSWYWYMVIEEPLITRDFLDDGVVLMFLKLEGNGAVLTYPLPLTASNHYFRFLPTALDAGVNPSFPDGFNGIEFGLTTLDQTPVDTSLAGPLQTRYVLIPGGVQIAGSAWEDYAALATALGIAD